MVPQPSREAMFMPLGRPHGLRTGLAGLGHDGAGFGDVQTWLEEQPVTTPDAAAFAAYLKTVVVGPYLAVLPEQLHDAFVEAVAAADARAGGTLTVDYVRLNMTGRRGGADDLAGETVGRTAP